MTFFEKSDILYSYKEVLMRDFDYYKKQSKADTHNHLNLSMNYSNLDNQRNIGCSVRIVFNRGHPARDIIFIPFEIYYSVLRSVSILQKFLRVLLNLIKSF